MENAFGSPDCTKTEISGYLLSKTRQGLSGYKVRVGAAGGSWSTTSDTTGTDGRYNVRLAFTPTAGRWESSVVDSTGRELSPRVLIATDATNCQPTQSGIQLGRVDFRKDY